MSSRRRKTQLSENWSTATDAIRYLRDGLCPFVDRVVQVQHRRLMNLFETNKCNQCSLINLLPDHALSREEGQPCIYNQKNCPCIEKKPNGRRKCPENVCGLIYDEILDRYFFQPPTPCWQNTDVSKWCSDAWEVAKCFISFPGYEKKTGPTDIDCTGLLHVLINNIAFNRYLRSKNNGRDAFCKVRGHIEAIFSNPLLELDQNLLDEYLGDMIKVLHNRRMRRITECQDAVQNIIGLTTDEHNSEEIDEGISFSENEEEDDYAENINNRFSSRYDTEFQHVAAIGRGAYGVVFKAKHRIDLTTYAVKRITVPKRYHIYALGNLC